MHKYVLSLVCVLAQTRDSLTSRGKLPKMRRMDDGGDATLDRPIDDDAPDLSQQHSDGETKENNMNGGDGDGHAFVTALSA